MKYYVDIDEDNAGRGWYICVDEFGFEYLFNDGVVRHSIRPVGDAIAFWPTEKLATAFYKDWTDD